jgi:hypothetical protein
LKLALQDEAVREIPFIWFWPSGAAGCVSMTHDVETELGRAFCDRLAEIDLEYGIRAAFQLIPEERYEVTDQFVEGLWGRGLEVGVHDLNHDGKLFDNRLEFERRAELINGYLRRYRAKGYRSGVLYRNTDWYQALNCSYDMSMPNVAPLDPQRGGCCTVRPYFIGKILEIPLTTVQDYTLSHVLRERSIDLWKQQIELILAKNGLVSFIVHPDYIQDADAMAVYRRLLAHLADLRKQMNLWFALPGEIDTWWRARSKMSVVREDAGWRIEGEGAGRAVLAFARLVDHQLVYELATDSQHAIAM